MDQFLIFAIIAGAALGYDHFSQSGLSGTFKTAAWFFFVVSAIVFTGRHL